jgi:uncharacterized protein YfiM (DUF2279 family)
MRGMLLVFALQLGQDHPRGDRWLAPDKAKHFFTAAFVQTLSFGALRSAGVSRDGSFVAATVFSAGASVGKEIQDRRSGGAMSVKDVTWDAAGIAAATLLLRRTER